MTIEQVIQKAIEGGYKLPDLVEPYKWEVLFGLPAIYPIFLDPTFWQALAYGMGWDKKGDDMHCESLKCDQRKCEYAGYKNWKEVWHRFIDHLAEGGTAESFFETL